MSALKPRLPGICAELPGGWLSPSWVDPADVRGDEPGQTGERAAGTSAVLCVRLSTRGQGRGPLGASDPPLTVRLAVVLRRAVDKGRIASQLVPRKGLETVLMGTVGIGSQETTDWPGTSTVSRTWWRNQGKPGLEPRERETPGRRSTQAPQDSSHR